MLYIYIYIYTHTYIYIYIHIYDISSLRVKETKEEKILVACMGNKMLIWYGESGLLKTVCVTFRCRYSIGTKVDH